MICRCWYTANCWIQVYFVAIHEFIRNRQSAWKWDKLWPTWDWDKSAVSISAVRLYNFFMASNEIFILWYPFLEIAYPQKNVASIAWLHNVIMKYYLSKKIFCTMIQLFSTCFSYFSTTVCSCCSMWPEVVSSAEETQGFPLSNISKIALEVKTVGRINPHTKWKCSEIKYRIVVDRSLFCHIEKNEMLELNKLLLLNQFCVLVLNIIFSWFSTY